MLLSAAPGPRGAHGCCVCPVELLREAERSVFAFYCLVRSGAPVWRLEEVREQEVRVWDGGRGEFLPLTPGRALVYALVHDRTDYSRALLRRYGLAALTPDPCTFCTRSVGPAHVRLAVRYDRQEALQLILGTLKSSWSPAAVASHLDALPQCSHSDEAEAAVALAVALGRSRCLLMLLASGATATGLDAGIRQLEAGLQTERAVPVVEQEVLRCVYFLLLFGHTPSPRPLDARLQCILGTPLFQWLSGQAPPTLLLHALRAIAQTAPGAISQLPPVIIP